MKSKYLSFSKYIILYLLLQYIISPLYITLYNEIDIKLIGTIEKQDIQLHRILDIITEVEFYKCNIISEINIEYNNEKSTITHIYNNSMLFVGNNVKRNKIQCLEAFNQKYNSYFITDNRQLKLYVHIGDLNAHVNAPKIYFKNPNPFVSTIIVMFFLLFLSTLIFIVLCIVHNDYKQTYVYHALDGKCIGCRYNKIGNVLKCGHTFCDECIKEKLKYDKKNSTYVKCIVCDEYTLKSRIGKVEDSKYSKTNIRYM